MAPSAYRISNYVAAHERTRIATFTVNFHELAINIHGFELHGQRAYPGDSVLYWVVPPKLPGGVVEFVWTAYARAPLLKALGLREDGPGPL